MAADHLATLAPQAVTFAAAGETENFAFDAGSDANRHLLVCVFWRDPDDANISGVTYNGVAMTAIGAKVRANAISMQVWELANPASGSNTIAVTMAAAGGDSAALVAAWVGNGTNGTTDGFATASGTASTANVPGTSSVTTSLTNDRAVFFFGGRSLSQTLTASESNYTERRDANDGAGRTLEFGDAAGTGATINATGTWSNTGGNGVDWVSVGVNVKALAAVATNDALIVIRKA